MLYAKLSNSIYNQTRIGVAEPCRVEGGETDGNFEYTKATGEFNRHTLYLITDWKSVVASVGNLVENK